MFFIRHGKYKNNQSDMQIPGVFPFCYKTLCYLCPWREETRSSRFFFMTLFEILEFNRELIAKLVAAGVKADDCKYIDLYIEYTSMRRRGEKVTYAVTALAVKYRISERKVYALLKRFAADCTRRAAE